MTPTFDVVFGIFLAAMAALAVVSIRWAARRDRVARTARAAADPPSASAHRREP